MKGKKKFLYTLIIAAMFFVFVGSVNAEMVCCKSDGTIVSGLEYNAGNANKCNEATQGQGDWAERGQCRKVCCDLKTGNVSTINGKCDDETHKISSEAACSSKAAEYQKTTSSNTIGGSDKCIDNDIKNLLSTAKSIYKFMQYITPAILVIMGSVDFMRATISSSAEDMEKNKKRFFNRLGLAVLVFLVFAIVQLVMNLLTSANVTNGRSWIDCWNALMLFK